MASVEEVLFGPDPEELNNYRLVLNLSFGEEGA